MIIIDSHTVSFDIIMKNMMSHIVQEVMSMKVIMQTLVLQRDLLHVEYQCRRPSHVLVLLLSFVFLGGIRVTRQAERQTCLHMSAII